MPKATHAEKETRVNLVYDLLLGGATRWQILQYGAKHEWGLKARQIDNYIADANALIASEAEFHRAREIGKAKGRLEMVIKRALNISDFATVLRAQAELNKLFSLYEPEPMKVFKIIGMDEAQLQTVGMALQRAGLKPSEVFNAMLEQLAEEKASHEE